MLRYPVWFISLYILGFVFNLCVSLMMYYLRLRGGSGRYTKSQLWALSLLASLFLLNSILIAADTLVMIHTNLDVLNMAWIFQALSFTLTTITAFILLCFGLVYPRPLMDWKRLKWVLGGVLAAGLIYLVIDISQGHQNWLNEYGMDSRAVIYYFGIFIPVFIWLAHYSRSPSKETRMMYTIFIWGYLFVHISRDVRSFLLSDMLNSFSYVGLVIGMTLTALALIRMGYAIFGHRKFWSRAETVNIVLAVLAVATGIVTGQVANFSILDQVMRPTHLQMLAIFVGTVSGWVLLRPVLFSYGLLRYRLLGSQVKPERAMAAIIAVLGSTGLALAVLNLLFGLLGPISIPASIAIGLLFLFPFWKASIRYIPTLLPMSATAKEMPMKERRNIYLTGLHSAVVRGGIADEEDQAALDTIKEELGITDREHELLMESIKLHEARLLPQKAVEEAFLIHQYGLLIAHHRGPETASQEDSDSDIFAGMFTAITEYVGDAMEKGDKDSTSASTDAISYGPSSLVMEKEGHVILAALISGADDLDLRQLMRDTLADIVEKYPSVNHLDWDGNLEGLEGLDGLLTDFASRVKRRGD